MYKPKLGNRKGQAPFITVPRTTTQMTYFNVPLVKHLKEKGYNSLVFDVNVQDKEIKITQAKEGERGYKVLPTGLRGHGVSPRIRKLLPAGRYVLRDKRTMVFKRED